MRMSKKIDRRLDNKRERAQVRQTLDGGHPSQPGTDRWNYRPNPAPVLDQPSNGKKRGGKGCKKNHGGPHIISYKKFGRYYGYYGIVCARCGKRRWGSHEPSKTWINDPHVQWVQRGEFDVTTVAGQYVNSYSDLDVAIQMATDANDFAAGIDLEVRYVVRHDDTIIWS